MNIQTVLNSIRAATAWKEYAHIPSIAKKLKASGYLDGRVKKSAQGLSDALGTKYINTSKVEPHIGMHYYPPENKAETKRIIRSQLKYHPEFTKYHLNIGTPANKPRGIFRRAIDKITGKKIMPLSQLKKEVKLVYQQDKLRSKIEPRDRVYINQDSTRKSVPNFSETDFWRAIHHENLERLTVKKGFLTNSDKIRYAGHNHSKVLSDELKMYNQTGGVIDKNDHIMDIRKSTGEAKHMTQGLDLTKRIRNRDYKALTKVLERLP